jgi:hypothetical protein
LIARARAISYGLLALLLGYLSLDDGIGLHEEIGDRAAVALGLERFADRLIETALVLPIVAPAFVLLWIVANRADGRAQVAVRGGLVLLVGAIVVDFIAAAALDRPETAYALAVALEEGLELGAWIIIAAGLVALALDELRRQGE